MTSKTDSKQSFSRLLYSTALYLLIPFIVFRLLVISIRKPAYRKHIRERFGYVVKTDSHQKVIWVHAVSVGEVNASKPLIEQIIKSYPNYQVLITTMTPTGKDSVMKYFGNGVTHSYIPYDLPDSIRRFILRIKPELLIIMETEIWPNLFYVCRNNNIPVVIVNARMSEKSFNGYKRLPDLIRNTLSNINCVIAQGHADAKRFATLGSDENSVTVSGSIKFDIKFSDEVLERGALIHRDLFLNRPVWIAASTHSGEEQLILSAFGRVLKQHPDCLLVIAPRHPDRAEKITSLSDKSGFITVRKSQGQKINDQVKVYLLDTLGELPEYIAASDLAFVGGSLIPHGGHNMLEPACLGLPVITGPYNHNFSDISEMLQNVGAAWIVADIEQLVNQVNLLLADKELRRTAGEKGRKLVEANRGSIHRIMEILRPYLKHNEASN